jgi:hypothetical protein
VVQILCHTGDLAHLDDCEFKVEYHDEDIGWDCDIDLKGTDAHTEYLQLNRPPSTPRLVRPPVHLATRSRTGTRLPTPRMPDENGWILIAGVPPLPSLLVQLALRSYRLNWNFCSNSNTMIFRMLFYDYLHHFCWLHHSRQSLTLICTLLRYQLYHRLLGPLLRLGLSNKSLSQLAATLLLKKRKRSTKKLLWRPSIKKWISISFIMMSAVALKKERSRTSRQTPSNCIIESSSRRSSALVVALLTGLVSRPIPTMIPMLLSVILPINLLLSLLILLVPKLSAI